MKKEELLLTLEQRFIKNPHRHPNIAWEYVLGKINNKKIIEILTKMEATGGEPDVCEVIIKGVKTLIYTDFSKESPSGRRSLCFDKAAWNSRKQYKPLSDVASECSKIGANLIDEDIYKQIQDIEPIDLKTSSWIVTPENIRKLGGALFGDNRYEHTFIYHNGAESYYAARGFRVYITMT